MPAWQIRWLTAAALLAGAALCAGAQARPAAAKPKPGPPAGVPTEYGRLVRVERRPSTTTRVIVVRPKRLPGVAEPGIGHNEIQKAEEGKEFLILHFSGTSKLKLTASGTSDERLLGAMAGELGVASLVRSDSGSTLEDGAGNKFKTAYFSGTHLQRQLAFEIPLGASGLMWTDGKASFQLEPKVLRVETPEAAPAP